MKNFVLATLIVLGMSGFSFGGDCANGFCNRPVGRVLVATKTVVKETVRVPRRIVSACVNGRCNSRTATRVK
jgi:hypothetical protein